MKELLDRSPAQGVFLSYNCLDIYHDAIQPPTLFYILLSIIEILHPGSRGQYLVSDFLVLYKIRRLSDTSKRDGSRTFI